jgi:pimeloyl-ACP methyl ester carboxylesterase
MLDQFAGESRRARLVVLGGLPSDARVWGSVQPRILPETQVVHVPLEEAHRHPSFEAFVDACGRRVDQVLLETDAKAVLVSISLGGYVAAQALARHATRCVGAIFCSPVVAVTPEEGRGNAAVAAALEDGSLALPELQSMVDHLWGDKAERTEPVDGMHRAIVDAVPKEEWVQIGRLTARLSETEQKLERFSVPTTIVCARGDRIAPLANAQALLALSPNARMRLVEGTSHILPLTHADLIAEAINEHLASVDAAGGLFAMGEG